METGILKQNLCRNNERKKSIWTRRRFQWGGNYQVTAKEI
jgi:hypothetical protein